MTILTKVRRRVALLAVLVTTLSGFVATQPVAADPILPLDWTLDAQTHLNSLDLDVDVTGGRFVGQVDLGTGDITGDITLPRAETQLQLIGLPLAKVAFEVAPVGPATGHVDLSTLTATLTSTFDIKVPYVRPLGIPFLNLVGNRCQTATSITLTLSGPVDLVGGSTFSGTFAVPKFKNCGIATAALNLVVPGDGNTFTATARPPA
jgi:hypothetical protein